MPTVSGAGAVAHLRHYDSTSTRSVEVKNLALRRMQSNAFADRGHVHRLDPSDEHLRAVTKVHEAFAADGFEQLHGAFDGDVVWRRALARQPIRRTEVISLLLKDCKIILPAK